MAVHDRTRLIDAVTQRRLMITNTEYYFKNRFILAHNEHFIAYISLIVLLIMPVIVLVVYIICFLNCI